MPPSTITIDFEASSLHGHPVEVGVAVPDRVANEIRGWSTLIRPTAYWPKNSARRWDLKAEEIHGISVAELEAGLHPREAMHRRDQSSEGESIL